MTSSAKKKLKGQLRHLSTLAGGALVAWGSQSVDLDAGVVEALEAATAELIFGLVLIAFGQVASWLAPEKKGEG